MCDLIPYGKQFEKIVDIIKSTKECTYCKVKEELILMYRDVDELLYSYYLLPSVAAMWAITVLFEKSLLSVG